MDNMPLTHKTASLLVLLRVAGAPLLTSLPIELLYGIFTAGGLEKAFGWCFEEQCKTKRLLNVDAICMIGNFTDNTHAISKGYRLEGIPVLAHRDERCVMVPRLFVRNGRLIGYGIGGPNAIPDSRFVRSGPQGWLWTRGLERNAWFRSLLETKQMWEWLKHCEDSINK